MGILSIQSQVVSGFVGNSAASFALQRIGREIWPLPTVLLSNHPGHGSFQGGPVASSLKASILKGLAQNGALSRCEAVISGYLSGRSDAALIEDTLKQLKSTAVCIYLCDPVLGDDGRTYVSAEVVEAIKQLITEADIVTPNAYELGLLSGFHLVSSADAVEAMRALQAKGPEIVFHTSFIGSDTPFGKIDAFILDRIDLWRLRMPKLNYKFSGAGDLLAALFLHFWLSDRCSEQSMAKACSMLFSILQQTMNLGSSELVLVRAQDHLVISDNVFTAEQLA